MDFFEHQARARRKTPLLIAYFVVAVVLIILVVYLAFAAVLLYGEARGAHGSTNTLWFPDVFAAVSLGTIVLVAIGSLYKIAELSGGGETVARALGGRRVSANASDLGERVLLNVVEEMAIASGTPVPPVFLLDKEEGINAFAAGTLPQNAVVSVTRGAVETLSRDELQGVIGHEFSHILNGDMRLNIRLIGLLNGILLIATIGYILMRSGSSSSNSDEKKGGNPLPLLGLCLYVIGYVGVFFGRLIKSTVSRQREFLADASAVQFTRLPDGIAGALKKIGGLAAGSQLQAPQTEEASHMFFGNGLTAPFLQLLSTHPPLDERIRRIDPQFNGTFPVVLKLSHSQHELVDPRTLAARRGTLPDAHAAAAGKENFSFDPAAAVAQVGAPRNEHLEYAAALVASLPRELATGVHDPLGAVATIYALLLSNDEPQIRQTQLEYLAKSSSAPAYQETLRLAPFAPGVKAEEKLPLVSMVLPALGGLSSAQLATFRDDITFLIEADQKVSLFEYAVRRLVLKRLLPRLERQPPREVRYHQLSALAASCSGLLSTLAYSGTSDQDRALRAFRLGVAKLTSQVRLWPPEECGLKAVDTALDQLAGADLPIRKQVLEACAATIGADGRTTVEESELLRVIADALECPMPPVLPTNETEHGRRKQ